MLVEIRLATQVIDHLAGALPSPWTFLNGRADLNLVPDVIERRIDHRPICRIT